MIGQMPRLRGTNLVTSGLVRYLGCHISRVDNRAIEYATPPKHQKKTFGLELCQSHLNEPCSDGELGTFGDYVVRHFFLGYS